MRKAYEEPHVSVFTFDTEFLCLSIGEITDFEDGQDFGDVGE